MIDARAALIFVDPGECGAGDVFFARGAQAGDEAFGESGLPGAADLYRRLDNFLPESGGAKCRKTLAFPNVGSTHPSKSL